MQKGKYSTNVVLSRSVCRGYLRRSVRVYGCVSISLLTCSIAAAPARQTLADLSLEELAQINVTSVSKTEKSVAAATAAIYVITEKAIHQSAVATLPEALRLAPNLQVARVDAHRYAITARGFNSTTANKLLVLIDGRSVYSPLFSGVFWDEQDVVLEDLDRIEVVSGPGGTLWGANAVNGVINIVSRSADQTQGELIALGASANEQQAVVRYGDTLANDGHYRVYVKYNQHEDTRRADGSSNESGGQRTLAGFRADWQDGVDALTVQGDAYSGDLHQTGTADINISGAHILARASHVLSPQSTVSLQAYVDHSQRDRPQVYQERVSTVDIELQHHWTAGKRHNVVWGGGYRYTHDDIENRDRFAFLPEERNMRWQNVFVQDELKLFDNVRLTLGAKLEYNPFTQWEALPSAHLAWVPDSHELIWTSLSHVVRSPSRFDRDLFNPANPEVVDGVPRYDVAGGPNFVSEEADVFELGYRRQHSGTFSYSVTGFYTQFDKLRTLERGDDGFTRTFVNGAEADSYGVEFWASWQTASRWRMHAGWVRQHLDVDLKPGSDDESGGTSLASADPNYYGQLRSSYDFSDVVGVHSTLRHVAELEDAGVPAYTELDLSVSWTIRPRLNLLLVGRNLLNDAHPEFGAPPERSEYERTLYGKVVWGL